MKQTYETGILGECEAEAWLREHAGMECLKRRYRNKCGEIDLIMRDGDVIVFVEVKTRKNAAPGAGMMSVNKEKQRRIARAAMLYLIENRMTGQAARFDVAEVNSRGIIHVKDAFQPGKMFYR